MGSIRTQDLYKAVVTEVSGIASSGDVNFTVSTPPSRTNGFLVLSPDNALNRETVYFHNVIGSRIYVRGVNRKNPKAHSLNDLIQMNDVEEIFNYYADMTSPLFYVEKTGSLNVLVWGGTVLVNRTQVTVADTALALTDNTTNYIVYDYLTNVISVNTTGVGLVKATVVTASGIITSITYNVIKESYADPYVPDLALVAPEVQKQTWVYALATGAVNTYAITLTPAPTAYATGQKFTFKANLANTGTATLNVNGLGAKTIKKLGGTSNIANGDILLGQIVEVVYNGTYFDMVSPVSAGLLDINGLTTKSSTLDANDTMPIYDSVGLINKKHLVKASTTNEGLVEMATDAEAIGYTDQTRYINPKQAWDITNKVVYLDFPSMIPPSAGGATLGTYGWSFPAASLAEIDFALVMKGPYTSISSMVFHFVGKTTNTGVITMFTAIRRLRDLTGSNQVNSSAFDHTFVGTANDLTNISGNSGLFSGTSFQNGDVLFFAISRNGAAANDTYTGATELIGVTITFA